MPQFFAPVLRPRTALLLSALLIASTPVLAAEQAALVAQIMQPAWVQQENGNFKALRAGMLLERGDTLRTGKGARIELRLSEGSSVKIGESAELKLQTLLPAEDNGGIFKASLNVLKGAFRFTTSAVGKLKRREVNIQVATLTAGIRGTDIWGKSDDNKDVICLIEGKIAMAHSGGENAMMETPMMFMVAPKGKPMLPVTAVDAEKLKGWATETDTVPGQGISSDTGTWALYLGAYKREATATRLVNLLSDAGYAAEITVRRAQGKTWQVVRLTGFDTENDAAAFVGPMIVLFPELHPRMAPM